MKIPRTAKELIELFQRQKIRADKRLGQNFLVDANLLRYVAEAAELTREDLVLEIGTGTGLLAREIAQRCGRLVTVELDRALAGISGGFLAEYDNITHVAGDVMKSKHLLNPAVTAALGEFAPDFARIKVVSNLPYNISTPFIGTCAEGGLEFERMVLMVQKEVAERLVAQAGTKDYGYLTVMVQYHCAVRRLKDLPPQVFWPSPAVTSSVIRVMPQPVTKPARDYETFSTLARTIFNHRRKSLYNSISYSKLLGRDKAAIRAAIEAAGFGPEIRGENLSIEQMIELADAIAQR